jgi:acyl-CoA thioester hydrolase
VTPARARPEPRAAFAVFRDVQPQWRDNDVYGHVNNAVHYTWFDSAVNGWLLDQGLLSIGARPVVGLVVASGCEYFAEVAFPDRVACGLRVARVGATSVGYELGLFRNDEPLCFALGRFVHVYVAWPQRRPVPLAPELRAAVETLRTA